MIEAKERLSVRLGRTRLLYSGIKLSSYFNLFITYLKPNRVNFHTGGLLGEYEVEGCKGTSPTLVLERDQTYTMVQASLSNPYFTPLKRPWSIQGFASKSQIGKQLTFFLQEDVTNWMHPLGFAYYPDGAHGFKEFAEVFIWNI